MSEPTTPETAREARQTITSLSDALTNANHKNDSARENHSIAAHERLTALRENFDTATAGLGRDATRAVSAALSTAITNAKLAIRYESSPGYFEELTEAVARIVKAYDGEWEPELPEPVETSRHQNGGGQQEYLERKRHQARQAGVPPEHRP